MFSQYLWKEQWKLIDLDGALFSGTAVALSETISAFNNDVGMHQNLTRTPNITFLEDGCHIF